MFNIYCAVVTPFLENYKIDFLGFKRIIDKLINDGIDGIIVGGTTGEAPTLSNHEKVKLYEFASLLVGERVKLYLGVGSNDTKGTIDFMEKIENIKCDGYLVVVPYYNKPSQKGLFEHFKMISSKTMKDIWLYNIPGRTGISLTLDTIKELSKIPNIKGIKEASNNFLLMEQIKKETDLVVYIGEDHLAYEAFKRGLDGVISVAAHIFTPVMKKMIEEKNEIGFNEYKVKFQVLFYEPNPVMIKSLLAYRGLINDCVRLPHARLDRSFVESYHNIIENDDKLS